jgi:hypothetical protein
MCFKLSSALDQISVPPPGRKRNVKKFDVLDKSVKWRGMNSPNF